MNINELSMAVARKTGESPIVVRTGRNPRTGEAIQIKAGRAPVFKAYSALKAQMNAV